MNNTGSGGAAGASVTLCATQRLARNLQLAEGQRRTGLGETVWPTLPALTVDAWLAQLGEQIALCGEASPAEVPARVLSAFEEALVWRRVIQADAGLELFDLDSLARTAAEAHALSVNWHLPIDLEGALGGSEEWHRFAGWRRAFLETCRRQEWLDAARYRERVGAWIARGLGDLPGRIVFAGFEAPSPQLRRLQAVLEARGVAVATRTAPLSTPVLQVVACKDAEAECRAASAWARAELTATPAARLGIVVADLESRRALLAPILDAALQPELLRGASDAATVRYNISLGLPLARHELVATALELLRALATPQGMTPDAFGALLRLPYWSADDAEADLRARLDAQLRERPGQNISLGTVRRMARALGSDECLLARHLRAFAEAQSACRGARLPGKWAAFFRDSLAALGWPGDRTLSSTEFQARAAFLEVLAGLAALDEILGSVPVGAAVGELARLCTEKIFQPKTPGQPPVQVLGMLEAGGAAFDALWVMGMNDDRWPPPPKPNPLLPAELQRRHATPGASAEVQLAFARKLHADLLHAAPRIVFSHAAKDGERALRPCPLLAGLAVASAPTFHDEEAVSPVFETLDDAQAPPVAEGEHVAGGCHLLKAQALCPAWAFYRYRLGAKALETPVEGLDARQRGTLVHATLESFWKNTGGLAGLQALRGEALTQAVATAAEAALAGLESELGEVLTPRVRRLEAARLIRLCQQWLRVEWDAENGRGRVPFTVQACEEKHTVTLGHLNIRLVIDRIDVLDLAGYAGQRIVIDYKTGGKPNVRQWAGDRITEPQLPLYAAFVLSGEGADAPVAAVAFAKLKNGECAFAGLALADDLLPGVPALKTEGDQDVATAWQALLDGWREKLLMIADEIQRGDAAVRFEREQDLEYCEVRPLLRLAERQRQFELATATGGAS